MNCTPTTKQRESLVQRVVGSAQAMAERLLEQTIADKPLLEEMEKAVMAALHGFGNELLSALVEVRSEQYPQPTIACACGAEAHYQRQRRAQCKTLLGTVKSQRAYYLWHIAIGAVVHWISNSVSALAALVPDSMNSWHCWAANSVLPTVWRWSSA